MFTEDKVEAAVSASLDLWLTLGSEGSAFEKELAAFLGVDGLPHLHDRCHWPGRWLDQSDPSAPHEAGLLNLVDKAHHQLDWAPRWDFSTTVERTVNWYRRVQREHASALECCGDDLAAFCRASVPPVLA